MNCNHYGRDGDVVADCDRDGDGHGHAAAMALIVCQTSLHMCVCVWISVRMCAWSPQLRVFQHGYTMNVALHGVLA